MNTNTNQAKSANVLCEVTLGSILGPLLFFIFINDSPLYFGDSNQSVGLYADDTTLYDIGLDRDMLENNPQHSLDLLKI